MIEQSSELEQLRKTLVAQQAALDDAHLVIGQQQVTLLRQAKLLDELQTRLAQTSDNLKEAHDE